jgi:tetratricopeptide (TPR) repeat protein
LFEAVSGGAVLALWAEWATSLSDRYPHNPIALYLFADAKARLGELEEAIDGFTQALQIEQNFALAFDARGQVYDDKGEYDQAIFDYSKAIEANPMHVAAYYNRGYVYATGKGLYYRAIEDYDKAIELDPLYAKAYNNRGVAYNRIGQYELAIADYSQALMINPRYAKVYNNRGATYSKLGQYDLAITDYDVAIALNSNYAEAYNNRGVAYKQKGRYAQVEAEYRFAFEIGENRADSSGNAGGGDYVGQYEHAICDFDTALELDPQYAAAYLNKGNACCYLGKFQEAIDAYSAFVRYATPEYAQYIKGVKYQIRKLRRK